MAGRRRVWLAVVPLFALVATLPGLAEGRAPTWAETASAAAGCVVLPWCRRYPVGVFAAAAAAALVSLYLTRLVFPGALPLLVALFAVGASRPVSTAVACTLAAVVSVTGVVQLTRHIPSFTLRNGTQLGWFVAAAAIGVAVQNQKALREAAEERTRRAEQTRESEALRRVGEERLRIAQELHDVIGHSIALINVQAGVASHLVGRDEAAAHRSLEVIRTTSDTALEEIATTLGLLRAAEHDVPPTGPVHGLPELPALLERARAGGLRIGLRRQGTPREVPAVIGATVYRLVQEALTNAVKHAGPGTEVRVRLAFRERELRVVVEDDGAGRGGGAGGTGLGLRGMRERVQAAGGTLEAGPTARGFQVSARIPTEAP
ncbi:sensor histidine kinase [Streptomyces sp. NPDC004126]|uniref:sensor histidine kinase n=1 Tax=Streptomyces sp. NPDC004126 TaxID=3390695 RepID=UPI003D03D3BC